MLYRVGVTGAAALTGAAYCDLVTTSARPAKVREIKVVLSTAVETSIGLIRSATTGTASTTAAGQLLDPADTLASTSLVGTAWSAAPTIGSVYLDKHVLAASIGAEYTWVFDDEKGVVIPVSASLVLWNFGSGTGGAPLVTFTWEE